MHAHPARDESFVKLSWKIFVPERHSRGCTIQPGMARKDPQQEKLASVGNNLNWCNFGELHMDERGN